jgi:hypothetical protein
MINTIKIQEREPDDIKEKEKEKDNKDETKNIREGLTEEGGVGFLFGILILTIPLAIYFLKNVYEFPYKFFKNDFKTILNKTGYDKDKFTDLYKEFNSILENNKLLNHKWILMLFFGFSYMALLVNQEDVTLKESSKWTVASIVGASVFILKFAPSVIVFFENSFGYFFVNLFSSLNLTLSLQNKSFKDNTTTIELNQLLTLFDVENLGKKFNQIGIISNDSNPVNDGTLLAVFNIDDETNDVSNDGKIYELFEHLLNASIMKRVIGETTMLIFTTLITISILKNYEGLG